MAKRSTELYVGVDPGQKGGIVSVDKRGRVIHTYVMPQTELGVFEVFNEMNSKAQVSHALIEWVHSRPQQSAQSGFTFGRGYGGLRMAMIAIEIPFEEVTPKKWQDEFSLKSKPKEPKLKFKDRIRQKAQQLFPKLPVWKSTLGDQRAICDALLIAEYNRRINK